MTEKQKEELLHCIPESVCGEIRIYALRLLRNRALAEEFAQEAFLRFLEYRKVGEVRNPRAWLYRTTRNMVYDYFRRQKKRREIREYLTEFPGETSTPDAAAAVEQKEDREMLLSKLHALSMRHQEVIRLKFQEKLTYDEIAEVTGESRSTVARLLSEAIQLLRASMADE